MVRQRGWRATKQNMEVRLVVGASKSRPAIHLNTTTFLYSRIECCWLLFSFHEETKVFSRKKYMILLSLDYNIYFFLRGVHAKCIDSSPCHSTCGHFFPEREEDGIKSLCFENRAIGRWRKKEKKWLELEKKKRNHLLGDQEAQVSQL